MCGSCVPGVVGAPIAAASSASTSSMALAAARPDTLGSCVGSDRSGGVQHYHVREAEPMLAEGDVARRLTAASLDIPLAVEVERAALSRAVVRAMRHASATFRGAVVGERQMDRVHLAVYPRLPGA